MASITMIDISQYTPLAIHCLHVASPGAASLIDAFRAYNEQCALVVDVVARKAQTERNSARLVFTDDELELSDAVFTCNDDMIQTDMVIEQMESHRQAALTCEHEIYRYSIVNRKYRDSPERRLHTINAISGTCRTTSCIKLFQPVIKKTADRNRHAKKLYDAAKSARIARDAISRATPPLDTPSPFGRPGLKRSRTS